MEASFPPVFIIASERSGTNLLRKRISENQSVYFGPPPAHFLKHLYYTQPFYGELAIDANFKSLINDALGLCYNHFAPWEVTLTAEDIMDQYDSRYPQRNVFGLMDLLMNWYARYKGYQTYICKDNNLFDFIYQLRYHLPNAKFIYLYRDPRDVVLSELNRKTQTDSVHDLAARWRDEQLKAFQIFQPDIRLHTFSLSYEDFVQEEETRLDELFGFLNIGKEYRNKKNIYEKDQTQEWQNLNKPTMKKNIKKFRTGLSKSAIQIIEQICGDEMKVLDYESEFPMAQLSKYRIMADRLRGNMSFAFRTAYYNILKNKKPVSEEKAQRLKYIKKFKRPRY